jgi:hypothetical protein
MVTAWGKKMKNRILPDAFSVQCVRSVILATETTPQGVPGKKRKRGKNKKQKLLTEVKNRIPGTLSHYHTVRPRRLPRHRRSTEERKKKRSSVHTVASKNQK